MAEQSQYVIIPEREDLGFFTQDGISATAHKDGEIITLSYTDKKGILHTLRENGTEEEIGITSYQESPCYIESRNIFVSNKGRSRSLIDDENYIISHSTHNVTSSDGYTYVSNNKLHIVNNRVIYSLESPPILKIVSSSGFPLSFYPDGNFAPPDPKLQPSVIIVSHIGIDINHRLYSMNRYGKITYILDDVVDATGWLILTKNSDLYSYFTGGTKLLKHLSIPPESVQYIFTLACCEIPLILINYPPPRLNTKCDKLENRNYPLYIITEPKPLPSPELSVVSSPLIIPSFPDRDAFLFNVEREYGFQHHINLPSGIDLASVPYPEYRAITKLGIIDQTLSKTIPVNPKSTWLDLLKQVDEKLNARLGQKKTSRFNIENIYPDPDYLRGLKVVIDGKLHEDPEDPYA